MSSADVQGLLIQLAGLIALAIVNLVSGRKGKLGSVVAHALEEERTKAREDVRQVVVELLPTMLREALTTVLREELVRERQGLERRMRKVVHQVLREQLRRPHRDPSPPAGGTGAAPRRAARFRVRQPREH